MEKNLPTDTTNCTDRHDKMSSSLNKEETIKGKEYNPPTPLDDIPDAQGDPVRGDSGKEGDFSLESKKEEPDWIEAKKILEADLTDGNFQTWIAPLIFERYGSEAHLRCPNQFFMSWLKSHFAAQIGTALESCGFLTWRLELMTEEQQKAAQESRQKLNSSQEQPATKPDPQPDVDELPLVDSFENLYQTYPRGERRQNAFDIFQNMAKSGSLPKISNLINAVKRAKNNNPAWQRSNGLYVPQLHKSLSEKRWLD